MAVIMAPCSAGAVSSAVLGGRAHFSAKGKGKKVSESKKVKQDMLWRRGLTQLAYIAQKQHVDAIFAGSRGETA